jgi:hypothetical protein
MIYKIIRYTSSNNSRIVSFIFHKRLLFERQQCTSSIRFFCFFRTDVKLSVDRPKRTYDVPTSNTFTSSNASFDSNKDFRFQNFVSGRSNRGNRKFLNFPNWNPYPSKLSSYDIRFYSSSLYPCVPNRSSGSSNSSGKDAFKEMYAVPYTISPDEALDKFEKWARNEQGLGRFLMNWNNVRISAVYTPVWSFTLNIRFILVDPLDPSTGKKRRRMDWKPNVFHEAYGTNQTIVHLPGLSAYAGHTYRRSLIDPLHNSSLLFMQNDIVRFGGWMMQDMKLSNGDMLPVTPDPWNTSRSNAYSVLKSNLDLLSNASTNLPSSDHTVTVQTELVAYQRVYVPTYVIDYKVFPNMQFQAFVSGCDKSAHVSGVSHKVFSDESVFNNPYQLTSSLYSAAEQGTTFGKRLGMGPREIGTLFIVFVQFIGGLSIRLLSRIPVIGFFVGITVGFRKVVQPWMDSRWATAEWERERNNEANTVASTVDDFVDSGTAQRYFQLNRERILQALSGNAQEHRGDYDWYKQWEQWARQQWEQQQGGSSHGDGQYQQQRRSRTTNQKSDYQWDFDPNDP